MSKCATALRKLSRASSSPSSTRTLSPVRALNRGEKRRWRCSLRAPRSSRPHRCARRRAACASVAMRSSASSAARSTCRTARPSRRVRPRDAARPSFRRRPGSIPRPRRRRRSVESSSSRCRSRRRDDARARSIVASYCRGPAEGSKPRWRASHESIASKTAHARVARAALSNISVASPETLRWIRARQSTAR